MAAVTPPTWLERCAPGFGALSPEERDAVACFVFLWSLFEAEALERNGNVNALVRIAEVWADRGALDEQSLSGELKYFQDRYYRDGSFTEHFGYLNLRAGDRRTLVERTMRNEETRPVERVAAVLIIVYRFRNNLFHGEKWEYQLEGQLENFRQANSVLVQAIEWHRASK